jgi:hypothetical protein
VVEKQWAMKKMLQVAGYREDEPINGAKALEPGTDLS